MRTRRLLMHGPSQLRNFINLIYLLILPNLRLILTLINARLHYEHIDMALTHGRRIKILFLIFFSLHFTTYKYRFHKIWPCVQNRAYFLYESGHYDFQGRFKMCCKSDLNKTAFSHLYCKFTPLYSAAFLEQFSSNARRAKNRKGWVKGEIP